MAVLGRILLYVHDIEAVAEFYACHFGFRIHREEDDRIVELESTSGDGFNIMLHLPARPFPIVPRLARPGNP